MLTYDLSNTTESLYKALYSYIKNDILSGKLKTGEKIPSKRALAKNLGISTITVENSYEQLVSEGYIYALPKKGYYVADVTGLKLNSATNKTVLDIRIPERETNIQFDFSSNRTESTNFPFSIWAKLMRETISLKEKELLEVSFCGGVYELRSAIANHLSSFRGINADPNQIIVGAGTEYLYGLLIKLLGNDKVYCVENPGYKKLLQIYKSNGATALFADMDDQGISISKLKELGAQIAHISPTHHFPTGISMMAKRRWEILSWAKEDDRYIIEDDYDSEFRINGKPLPALQSIDTSGKVIYMNTFSKSLTSTIRISYMVLPEKLANKFYEQLSFYSCTVSTFDQYTLAKFIEDGFFEKHINRMRLHYGRKRTRILEIIRSKFTENECTIIENDSGLHFLLQFNTCHSDKYIKERLYEKAIKLEPITDYYMDDAHSDEHKFLLNYSNMNIEGLKDALDRVKEIISSKGD